MSVIMDVRTRWILFFVINHILVDCTGTLTYKLNDGNEIPAIALGTSLGHQHDSMAQWLINVAVVAEPYFVLPRNDWVADLDGPVTPISSAAAGTPPLDRVKRGRGIVAARFEEIAVGTRVLPQNHSLALAVQWALEVGYRHVDTASLYRVEDEVGLGVRYFAANNNNNNFSRQDVYITTKLWNDAHEREEVIPALMKSLEQLQMDYVDLYLVHYPMAYKKDGSISNTDYLTTWQGMEDAMTLMNLTRSIGVSNFNLAQMQRLWDNSKIKPAVLQIEVNPTITQDELVNWCREHGVVVMGYSPFGAILGRKPDAPGPRVNDTLLQELAEKYNKTVPQILLRYLLDRNIVAIPRSTNLMRIQMNFDIEDFELSSEEVKKLSGFNMNYRLRTPAKWYEHPQFPFEKKNLTQEEIKYIIEHSKED